MGFKKLVDHRPWKWVLECRLTLINPLIIPSNPHQPTRYWASYVRSTYGVDRR
jgi:hypothetical protein